MKKASSNSWQIYMVMLVVAGLLALALSGYLNTILRSALSPLISLQTWFSGRYMAIYEFVTVPRDVASLRERNAQLESENSSLRTQIVQLQQQLREADVLYALLDFARDRPENRYVASAVIGRDPSPFLHYIIIDHGSDDGLRHGMPVVTERGLVGRVDAVTAGAARVQLITDPASAVNVRLEAAGVEALLSGSITGDVTLEMVPPDAALQTGDLILTSGLGGNYPPDVVVGQVLTPRKTSTELFQSASVQPAVDFTSLRAVLVIINFRPVNITPLLTTPVP
ncbi:MAG: rod shape-determining protein MreC [Anaerolineae bacterium]|nr:rod shape-determining protein MreC [Anaerolineae bacterium]